MTLAIPGKSGIPGAIFGMARNGGTTPHYGIDFYGEIGTEVFSMYDGIILNNDSGKVNSRDPSHPEYGPDNYVISQPNRDSNGQLPSKYTGDRNTAGNRINISSSIN